MVKICQSRHTPGVAASDVSFSPGDVVTYRLLNGNEVRITIDSDFMTHDMARVGGYEAYFPNLDGGRGFADIERIIDWEERTSP